ncbi:MAG: NAD(P)-dependent glycerol-3-phosphate dehydrogenase [Clostridia bacterium]|nr:NAD(P)-dependent glycerol-3-phosphate dehydrogenase [Clostridia bacterium]
MKTIAIIGSGTWGVALSIHLANLGNNVKVWSFSEEERDFINTERKCKFLPQAVIPDSVVCSTNFQEVIDDADFILHVTPSKFTRSTVKQYKEYVNPKKQPIIICSKGFEEDTMKTLDEVILDEIPNARVGALAGPSHAEEVSLAIPTLLVIASKDERILRDVQNTFSSVTMRLYTSRDIKGVELGGALKNIIAFCAGLATGINLGDNTFAALITRGLKELSRLGVELGGKKDTFYGLTGLGDLIVTCQSEHSRNRRAGKLIGEGKTLDETKKIVGMTIECIDNIEVAHSLAELHGIEMPILDAVYKILYNGLKPEEALEMLMTRDKKAE